MRKNLLLFLIALFFIHSCAPRQQDLVFELDLVSSKSDESPILIYRIKNLSDKNYYILFFNRFTDISFFNESGLDISDSIWNIYKREMPIPKPPLNYTSFEPHESDIFISKATCADYDFTKSQFHGSIPFEHEVELKEMLRGKYMVVDLVKAGEIFEKSYSLEGIDINSIAKIVLSYNNEIKEKTDSTEFFHYELDGNEYILQSFPLENVDAFHLFRGKMEYELNIGKNNN